MKTSDGVFSITAALSTENALGKKKDTPKTKPSITARISPVFFMKSARSTIRSFQLAVWFALVLMASLQLVLKVTDLVGERQSLGLNPDVHSSMVVTVNHDAGLFTRSGSSF